MATKKKKSGDSSGGLLGMTLRKIQKRTQALGGTPVKATKKKKAKPTKAKAKPKGRTKKNLTAFDKARIKAKAKDKAARRKKLGLK